MRKREPVIVINALHLGINSSGIGILSLYLLRAFLKIYRGGNCILLLGRMEDSGLRRLFPELSAGIEVQYISNCRRRIGRVAFEQLLLPRLLKKRGASFYLGLSFVRPLRVPRGCRTLVLVPDLFFLMMPEVYPWFTRLYYRFLVSRSIRSSDYVAVISESTRSDLKRFYPGKKAFLLPCALPDREREEDPDLADRLRGMSYFFCLGRVEKRKNLLNTIRAFKLYLEHGDSGSVLLVGGDAGYGARDVRRLIAKERLQDRVIFTGFIPDGVLHLYYRYAEAFLFVSRYEGFGIPILEAMREGCPVITSDVSSMPEVAGNAALCVPPEEPAAIAAGLYRLHRDRDLRKRLVHAGQERVGLYSWEKSAAVLCRFIGEKTDKG